MLLSPLPKTCEEAHQLFVSGGIVSHQPSEPAFISTTTLEPAAGIADEFSTVTLKGEGIGWSGNCCFLHEKLRKITKTKMTILLIHFIDLILEVKNYQPGF